MYVKINTQEEADFFITLIKYKGYTFDDDFPWSQNQRFLFRKMDKTNTLNEFYFHNKNSSEGGELVSIWEFENLLPYEKPTEFEKYTSSYDKNCISIDTENKKILDSLYDMLVEKNKKYGDAALNPLEIFAGKCKYGYRIDEKLARVKNSSELSEADVVDIMGGLVIICREKGWNDFSKFKQ